jgi:hypothetical protein
VKTPFRFVRPFIFFRSARYTPFSPFGFTFASILSPDAPVVTAVSSGFAFSGSRNRREMEDVTLPRGRAL